MLLSHRGLVDTSLFQPQVIKPQGPRQVRLVVTFVTWLGDDNVVPIRKARLPPTIILRDWMKLRQVEADRLAA